MTDAEWTVVRPLVPAPTWLEGKRQPEISCFRPQHSTGLRAGKGEQEVDDNGKPFVSFPTRLPAPFYDTSAHQLTLAPWRTSRTRAWLRSRPRRKTPRGPYALGAR